MQFFIQYYLFSEFEVEIEVPKFTNSKFEKIKVIKDRKLWELVKLSKSLNPLDCRWIYTVKKDQNGRIAQYKATLVAQGYRQIKGEM